MNWKPIDTAPLGQMVWLWQRSWRHPFPGVRNGDLGAVYIDTCEPQAQGWQSHADYWMPMPPLPTLGTLGEPKEQIKAE